LAAELLSGKSIYKYRRPLHALLLSLPSGHLQQSISSTSISFSSTTILYIRCTTYTFGPPNRNHEIYLRHPGRLRFPQHDRRCR
jgi:hypothetical protein